MSAEALGECRQRPPADYIGPMIRIAIGLAAYSWRRSKLKLRVRCSMRLPPQATERVMADFSCAWTKRTSHWPAPMSREAPVQFRVLYV
jgi:hypothetical protein